MSVEFYRKISSCIRDAEKNGLLSEPDGVTGYSGAKVVGTLQRLAKYYQDVDEGIYLEVGVYQGLTLISVAKVLDGNIVFGIDNFSQFDPKGTNKKIVHDRAEMNGLNNVEIIDLDYEDALENLEKYIKTKKIGVFFVDGPHDYRSQLVCLNLIKPYLSEHAVIVVDDSNYRHVRQANRDFLLANKGFKLIFESYTECHPSNMDDSAKNEAKDGWWNGVNIIVHDPEDVLDDMLPETNRNRTLYENEHIVHSLKYGDIAPESVAFFQSILTFRLLRAVSIFTRILMRVYTNKQRYTEDYLAMNTYSRKLTKSKYNESLK